MSFLAEPVSGNLAAADPHRQALVGARPSTDTGGPTATTQHEQVRALVQQLFFPHDSPAPRRVGMTAADPNTNIARLCFTMAITLAETGACDVGLVDAHPGALSLHRILDVPPSADLESALQIAPRVWLLPRMSWLPVNEEQVISDQSLARLGDRISQFDFSILCCAPVSWPTIKIAQACDGLVLVLTANLTRKLVALQMCEQLQSARIPLLGTVLTERRFPVPQKLYRNL